ncbi:MAG: twin-arginine translocase subunit TatB [Actinobacteria bacterium]|nr:twin-arginine translocase subunit TatB [Actinomycetota bacterium]
MFNIGPLELMVILVVALIVVGPKRLPEMGRSIGKSLREFRRASEEVRQSFEMDLGSEDPDDDDGLRGDREGSDGSEGAAETPALPDPAEGEEPAGRAGPRGSASE